MHITYIFQWFKLCKVFSRNFQQLIVLHFAGFRETNKHWHNSSAESRVIQCQAKELERNKNEANPKFYNNSASYLAHTGEVLVC